MNQNELFSHAVSIVRDKLSHESARIIRYSLERNDGGQSALQQSGFGLAIRNLLANNGILWEEVILYSVWFAILKEAITAILD